MWESYADYFLKLYSKEYLRNEALKKNNVEFEIKKKKKQTLKSYIFQTYCEKKKSTVFKWSFRSPYYLSQLSYLQPSQ